MAAVDWSVLEDESRVVPWAGLDALAAAAVGDAGVLEELVGRLKRLYGAEDPYEKENFEAVYLPYALLEVARRAGEAGVRRQMIKELVRVLVDRIKADDEGAMEYLMWGIETLPVDEYGPIVLGFLRGEVEPIESSESLSLWDMLGPVAVEGSAEVKEMVRAVALETLQRADEKKSMGSGSVFACQLLADLGVVEAVPLMKNLEKRVRRGENAWEANDVKWAIGVLEGKKERFERGERQTLKELVEYEREAYAEWYRERKEGPTADEDFENEEDFEEEGDMGIDEEVAEDEEYLPPLYPVEGGTVKEEYEDSYEPVKPIRAEKKVGRNEPCPCGSGKKYNTLSH